MNTFTKKEVFPKTCHMKGWLVFTGIPITFFILSIVISIISIYKYPINHDVSWLLYLAEKIVNGEKLYVDYSEVNPPLIIWLSIPTVVISEITKFSADQVFRFQVIALIIFSFASSWRILVGKILSPSFFVMGLSATYGIIALPGYDFGEREHLALIFILPYLADSTLRLKLSGTSAFVQCAAVSFGSIGLLLKPHFFLLPLLIETAIYLRTRRISKPQPVILVATACLYAFSVLLITPEYASHMQLISAAYWNYAGEDWLSFLSVPHFLVALVLFLFSWTVREARSHKLIAISIAAAGFAIAAVIQHKGWSYHWYPVAALSWLAFTETLIIVISRHKVYKVSISRVMAAALILFLSTLALISAPNNGKFLNPYIDTLAPAIRELGGGPVLIFAIPFRVSFPLVTQAGIGTSSRFPTVGGMILLSQQSGNVSIKKYVHQSVYEDIKKSPPKIIITESNLQAGVYPIDYFSYFSEHPELAEELSQYKRVKSLSNFDFFVKAE